ncbi:MAG TPA: SPFH domain-containing protein [Ktedonosporobacter sp.]|nr:SPFH domain-containing protein [Ktedonosporobacter sp.]
MSSDGKEPGPIRKGPPKAGWDDPAIHPEEDDPAQPVSQDALLLYEQEEDPHFHTPSPIEEDDQAADPASTPFEIFKRIAQYAVLILAPLLFAGLTSLFVLPLVANHQASISPEGFWLVAISIMVIAIGQIAAVYFAGANNGLWALATIGGFCLFLVVGCFTIFGPLWGILLLILLTSAMVWLTRSYFHPVPEGYVDVVYAFSKYSRTLYPGFNMLLPWEKVNQQLNVTETQWTTPLQQVQLSPSQDVLLRGSISYQLLPEDAHLAVTQVKQWEESLQECFIQCIQSIATTFVPDDFIPWQDSLHPTPARKESQNTNSSVRWEHINHYLLQEMSDKVALWGVQIHWVRIRDVMLAPHGARFVDTGEHATSFDPNQTTAVSPINQSAKGENSGGQNAVKPLLVQTPAQAPKIFSEDVLKKAYKEVQQGNVTDPDTIRDLAAQFEAISRDPKANQMVTFDAARAALNLYEQAQRNEEEQAPSKIKQEQRVRRSNDDNRMGGG